MASNVWRVKLLKNGKYILALFTLSFVFNIVWTYSREFSSHKIFNLTTNHVSKTDFESINSTENLLPIISKTSDKILTVIDNQLYPKIVSTFHDKTINFTRLNESNNTKLIVLWNKWYTWIDWKYGLGKTAPFEANKCPVTNCELTYDRSRLNETDLVILSGLGLRDKNKVPAHVRNNRTRLVLFNNESPELTSNLANPNFNDLFDLVAYYKRDSDFAPFYYADIEFEWIEKSSSTTHSTKKQISSQAKTSNNNSDRNSKKFAAALISNCNQAYSNRLELITVMRKYVAVDIYGKCGISCNINNENR
jgi:hypothetical protein